MTSEIHIRPSKPFFDAPSTVLGQTVRRPGSVVVPDGSLLFPEPTISLNELFGPSEVRVGERMAVTDCRDKKHAAVPPESCPVSLDEMTKNDPQRMIRLLKNKIPFEQINAETKPEIKPETRPEILKTVSLEEKCAEFPVNSLRRYRNRLQTDFLETEPLEKPPQNTDRLETEHRATNQWKIDYPEVAHTEINRREAPNRVPLVQEYSDVPEQVMSPILENKRTTISFPVLGIVPNQTIEKVNQASENVKMSCLAEPVSTSALQESARKTEMLVTEGLTKSYTKGKLKIPVLNGVNFTTYSGEFVSIVGQSGSGKSTLLHLLGTLDNPDSGTIFFDGCRIDRLSIARRDRLRNRSIGFIFQFYHLLPELTTLENVLSPLMIRESVLGYFVRRRVHIERSKAILEQVGLSHRLKHRPNELSGGEMQRAAIARALVAEPKILLADEPTGNLDSHSAQEIMELLRTLNQQCNLTIVMVTHDNQIAASADRIVRMVDGVIVPQDAALCTAQRHKVHVLE